MPVRFWYVFGMAHRDSSPVETVDPVFGPLLALAPLFDVVPEVFLYVKDRRSRFVHVNANWLRLRGFADVPAVVGKSDFDLHPLHLAERYVAEDERVMSTGQALPRQVWLVPGRGGRLDWYESSKFPLWHGEGTSRRVIGLAGVMWTLERADVPQSRAQLQEVIAEVARSPADEHPVPDLAARAGLSVSQFERTFRRVFRMTPRSYVQRVRVHAACESLLQTDESIAEIAVGSGFYDQSHFTKVFRRVMGITPARYRKEMASRPVRA